jgi:peptidoglycan/LPS O-acetylase OafA/YrhL
VTIRPLGVYFPGLNGLRALAATTVVFAHITAAIGGLGLRVPQIPNVAAFGVTVFFSLSGFLITFLLLQEKAQTETVQLGAFYARRILRIWPLYFFYLLLCLAWTRGVESTHFLYFILMVPNIPFVFGGGIQHAAHYWSLGVEEQFYLFWPALVKRSRNVPRSLIVFIGVFQIAKLAVFLVYGGWSKEYEFFYITRFDCMAIGGLGAWQVFSNPAWCQRLATRALDGGAWLLLGLVVFGFLPISSFVVHDVVAFLTVVVIINQIFGSRPLVRLENKPLDFVGRISFGVYVYHPLVIDACLSFLRGTNWSAGVSLAWLYISVVLITLSVAYLSYRFLEGPFLRLKETYSRVQMRTEPSA